MLSEQHLRDEIVRTGRMMYERGWMASSDGNITARLGPDRMLATPSGVCKGWLKPEDLIICDAHGEKISGPGQRTTEMHMHVAIYEERADVQAVVHAHPPTATGFAVAGRPLNLGLMPELIVSLGSVPLAEYGQPGTPALSDGMLPYVGKYNAILLANHGAVTYGDNIMQAYGRMETLEHLARISLVAELLGGPKVLSRVEVEKLFDSRKRYGIKVPNEYEPGNPVVAEDLLEEDLSCKDEKLEVTRQQILAMVEEALRLKGVL